MRAENGGGGGGGRPHRAGRRRLSRRARKGFVVVVVGFDFYFFGATRPSAICGGHRPCRGSRSSQPPPPPPRHLRIFASSASAPTTFSHHDWPAAAAADDCRGRTVAAVSRFRDSRVSLVRLHRYSSSRRGAKRAISVKRSPLRLDIVAGSVGYYALWSRWNKWSRSFTTTAHRRNCNSRRVPLFRRCRRRSSLPGRRKKKTARIAAAPRSSVTPSTGLRAYCTTY